MSETLYMRRVRHAQIMFEAVNYYAPDLADKEGHYVLVCLADDGRLVVEDAAGKFVCHAAPLSTAMSEVLQ